MTKTELLLIKRHAQEDNDEKLLWLIEQAEKSKQVEMIMSCSDYDNQAKLDNINHLFFNE